MPKYLFSCITLLIIWGCNGHQAPIEYLDIQKQLQTQFIMAEEGSVIEIDEGRFMFTAELSMDAKKHITIKGKGMDKTFLSFKNQDEGAEGLKITNSEHITIEDLTLQDSKGDLLKVQKTKGLICRNVKAEWTGKPKESNGAYAFYPVDCDNVLIENCVAIGASDAGIYVGQSRDIIVRNCTAYHNVAGIEIENCLRADVYDNLAYCNTGGILVFDMPDLTQNGNGVRIFNNKIEKNNYRNFAPEGNIVGEVPPGTGVMVLATTNVEIFNNQILNNKTAGTIIASYLLVRKKHEDKNFNPYPKGISIHDNTYTQGWFQIPELSYDVGKLLVSKFWLWTPDILYDGMLDPNAIGADGKYPDEYRICIRNNGNIKFANADADNNFENVTTDMQEYDCTRNKIPEVVLTL